MVVFLLSMACVLNCFSAIWLATKVNFKTTKKGKKNGISK